MRKATLIFWLMLAGYVYLGGAFLWNRIWARVDMPGERPACQLQAYASPDHKHIARVSFKMRHSNDLVDHYETTVALGPVQGKQGKPVFTLFCSTCVSCEWESSDLLLIYYWGTIDSDYKLINEWDGVKIKWRAVSDTSAHDPSRLR